MSIPINDTSTSDIPTMPYWSEPRWLESLSSVPFTQKDPAGNLVVNVATYLYKEVQGQLVRALVPRDLSMPDSWEPVFGDDPALNKARSMLGINGT